MLCCSSSQVSAKQVKTRCQSDQSVEASAGLVDDVCAEVAEADGHIAGYIIGKVEGAGPKQLGISEAKALTKSVTMSIYTYIYIWYVYILFFRSIALYICWNIGMLHLHISSCTLATASRRHACFDFRLLAIHSVKQYVLHMYIYIYIIMIHDSLCIISDIWPFPAFHSWRLFSHPSAASFPGATQLARTCLRHLGCSGVPSHRCGQPTHGISGRGRINGNRDTQRHTWHRVTRKWTACS